jgi:hypothetical protein
VQAEKTNETKMNIKKANIQDVEKLKKIGKLTFAETFFPRTAKRI